MRLSARSTLLTRRMIGRWASSAFRGTKRVCGSGPSDAAPSSSAPATHVGAPPREAPPAIGVRPLCQPLSLVMALGAGEAARTLDPLPREQMLHALSPRCRHSVHCQERPLLVVR